MMRPRWYPILLLPLLFAASSIAADGIQPGRHFVVPFAVDGESAINRATVYVDAAGKATLTVLYVRGDTIAELSYSLVRGEPEPGPDPKPDPKPDPVPPKPETLWGIVVEESLDRTPDHAAVYASPDVRGLFDWRRFRVLDKDGPVTEDMEPYRLRALAVNGCETGDCPLAPRAFRPVLFLAGQDGKLYYEGTPPATVADMVALFKRITRER
jgi:hypothetical protein